MSVPRTLKFAAASALFLLNVAVVRAADVAQYGVVKSQNFVQEEAAATKPDPARPFEGTLFIVPNDFAAIFSVSVRTPSGANIPLPDATSFVFTQSFPNAAGLNSSFGSGAYSFTFDTENDQDSLAQLNAPADAFGTTPLVNNFPETQNVSPLGSLTVKWNPFTEGTAGDLIQLRILDELNDEAFNSGGLGEFGALNGTATEILVPPGTFNPAESYTALLTFTKIAVQDTTSYPGALGLVTFSKTTKFVIKMSGGGGGGAPSLVFSTPSNGQQNVPVNTPIIFAFNTPMAPTQSITWSGAGLNPADFQYTWLQPTALTASYPGGLPANTTLRYTLNPAGSPPGFKDLAGNALPETSGTFTTAGGGGTPDPDDCSPAGSGSGFNLFKTIRYAQAAQGAPTIDLEAGVVFSASLRSPTNNPVTAASIKLPAGTTLELTNVFGTYTLFRTFATQEAMDAEFPAGAYVLTVKRSNGQTQTATVALVANVEPPVPQVANLNEAAAFNPASDFTLKWNAFSGAGPRDTIFVSLSDDQGKTFNAPDLCVPRELPNTATSVVVPKNSLSGSEIEGSLSFFRSLSTDTRSIPDLPATAGFAKTTEFNFQGGNPPPPAGQPRLGVPVRVDAASFRVEITGQAGATFQVQSSTDLVNWTNLQSVTLAANGSAQVTINTSAAPTFFRARSP